MWKSVLLVCAVVTLGGCGGSSDSSDLGDFRARTITLPDGTVVRAEVMMVEQDMMRGMMFRDTLPDGRGMFFVHPEPGRYPYWMYQVKVPLDIAWLDAAGKVVEVVESAPPCTTAASQCPNYGGNHSARYVLELPAGYGRRHGVVSGAMVRF